jgi:transposase
LPEGVSLEEILAELVELRRVVAAQAERITELERRLAADSSNSSRPPSSDAPWEKKPAKKRSSRGRSGRKPGKQPGASSVSRALVDDPDQTVVIQPDQCQECATPLADAIESGRERRQVVDVGAAPPPEVTEYQRVSKTCRCCGTVTTPDWDALPTTDPCRDVVAAPGSPVRIGPETLARAALLTCGHFLPVGRARALLETLTGMDVSTGWLAFWRISSGSSARSRSERSPLPTGDGPYWRATRCGTNCASTTAKAPCTPTS